MGELNCAGCLQFFLGMPKKRLQDIHVQDCCCSIEKNNSRCMRNKHLKTVNVIEIYLNCNYHKDLRQYLTKFRLSSHKPLDERGRWLIPKLTYNQRQCTLCGKNSI